MYVCGIKIEFGKIVTNTIHKTQSMINEAEGNRIYLNGDRVLYELKQQKTNI
jgi:hypothetical protein